MSIRSRITGGVAGVAAVLAVITAVTIGQPSVSAVTPSSVDAGTLTCTTDGSSYCTNQHHSLGVVPVAIVVTAKAPIGGSPIAANIDADSFTGTSFRIRVFQPNGTGFANRAVTYSYAAYAGPAPTTTAPATTTPAPTTATPSPTVPADIWPAPGSVGLQTATTHTMAGGRFADPGDFTSPHWTGTGTVADPFKLDHALVTDKLTLGCGCGSSALTSVYVELDNDWLQGTVGNPTPDTSRMLFVENDGPLVTVRGSSVRPAGTLNADGIRTDNACADKGILSYRPIVVEDSWVSGANVLVAVELERNETGTVVRHNELHGICSNPGDHTDVYNENGHGSNTRVESNYIDGVRSGGSVVNNGLGLYNDNIGQCDACATTENHTIRGNRILRYNIGVLSSVNTTLTLGPWTVEDNVFDSPTALGSSPGLAYDARTPTSQSGNSVAGSPVTF